MAGNPSKLLREGKDAGALLCSVVIPVYNHWEYTDQCLRSIARSASKETTFEVVVVNNGSTDGTRSFLNKAGNRYSFLRVVHLDRNYGFARACNVGARSARGTLLVFLNNDTVVLPGWLEALVDAHTREERAGIVGAKLLYPDGTIQHAGMVIGDAPAPLSPGHVHRGRSKDFSAANIQRDFQAVTGACMLVRRDIFDQVGGFDESYVNDCEDVDLCFKIRQMGWRVVYTPKSVLVHFESVSEGRFGRSQENLILLNRRWAGVVKPDYHRALPKVSIVLLNYNGTYDTIECLKSLYGYDETTGARPEKGLYYKPFQTIVVDNASETVALEGLRAWLYASGLPHQVESPEENKYRSKPFRQEVILLESSENLGFSGGCNAGIAYALSSGADYVWILNNDTVVHPLALWTSVAFFLQAHRSGMRVGAVGSKLHDYYNPQRVQFDGDRVYYGGMDAPQRPEADKIEFKTCVSGASMLLARKPLEECGGFDDAFFLYFEDNDLCVRLHNLGWRVVFHPKSIVYHKGGASIGDWISSPLSIYYATRNFLLFQAKHRSVDEDTFQMLRTVVWYPMAKDKTSIRAFIKGVLHFSLCRFGRTAPETIVEGWTPGKESRQQDISYRVLQRLEEVLTQNPDGQPVLDTLFQLAFAVRRRLTESDNSAHHLLSWHGVSDKGPTLG